MTTTTAPAPAVVHESVPVSKIALHPRNPRRVVGDVATMAASMLEVGVLEDLIVAPWPTGLTEKKPRGATYVLVAGHRRLAAARAAGLTEVPCKIRGDLDTVTKQLEAALIENLHREGLTPVEEADTYQGLLELDLRLTQAALAKRVGQPVSRVRERLKLAAVPAPVKEKVHSGQLTIVDGLAVASFDGDPKTQRRLLGNVGSSNFRHELEMAERDRKAKADFEARLQPYRDAGVRITDDVKYWDLPAGWKLARDLTPPQPGNSYASNEDVLAWDRGEHKDCPGRVILTYGTDVWAACSQGKLHPRPKPTKSKAQLKQEVADKKRRDGFAPASQAATAVRRRHLADCLAAANADHTVHVRPHLVTGILAPGHWLNEKQRAERRALVAELLAVGVDKNEPGEQLVERLEAAMSKLTLEGLVMLHMVMTTHKASEEHLAEVPRDGRFYGASHEWIRNLDSVFGYEFSDWERQTFKVDDVLNPGVDDALTPAPADAVGSDVDEASAVEAAAS